MSTDSIDTDTTSKTPAVNADRAILFMLLAVFGVGTVEYLVAGVLPDISSSVGVTDGTAGLLITVYAVTVVIGGPIMTVITARVRRTPLIAASMALFVVGNITTALAPNFGTLVLARIITALPHATFFALCLVLATSLVEPEFQGRVIARVTLGLNLATVLGVPLGTLLGNQIGWRWSFVVIAVFQVAVTAALIGATRRAPDHPSSGIGREIHVFAHKPVLWALGLTAVSQAALFVLFTYISPYLTDISGVPSSQVTIVLFLFGVRSVIGNQLGGYFADKSIDRTLYVALGALAVALAVLIVAGEHRWFATVWMIVVGAAGFSIIPPLASKLIGAASDAPHLAATVNIAGFQLANAAGAWIGSTPTAATRNRAGEMTCAQRSSTTSHSTAVIDITEPASPNSASARWSGPQCRGRRLSNSTDLVPRDQAVDRRRRGLVRTAAEENAQKTGDIMKAVTITSTGGPDRLVLDDVPELDPQPGDIVVDVVAAAVNPVDLKTRSGFLDIALTFPAVLGWDVSGTVAAVGPDVRSFTVGDRVVGMIAAPAHRYGTYAERVVADQSLFAQAPRSIPLEHAAALPLAGLTAVQTLGSLSLSDGQSVLVTGAAGAVGRIAVQLLLAAGHRVGAVARTTDVSGLLELGVDSAVTLEDVEPGTWDVVVDTAGLASSIVAVRDGGHFVSIENNEQPDPTRAIQPTKNYVEQDGAGLSRLVAAMDAGQLTVPVARTYSFADATRAHVAAESGGLRGKVVLIP